MCFFDDNDNINKTTRMQEEINSEKLVAELATQTSHNQNEFQLKKAHIFTLKILSKVTQKKSKIRKEKCILK